MNKDSLVGLGLVCVAVVFAGLSIWGSIEGSARARHEEFLRRQDVCATHDGWYEREDNYHGLMACYDLNTHEIFYVVPETGLALVPRE